MRVSYTGEKFPLLQVEGSTEYDLAATFWNNPGPAVLSIRACPGLVRLPRLPETLTKIQIVDCPDLVRLPALPPQIEEIDFWNCPQLSGLPKLPLTLAYLRLESCPNVSELPELPEELKFLRIFFNRTLRTLPLLPRSLMHVSLEDCSVIGALPDSYDGQELQLSRCPLIPSLPANCPRLKKLILSECGAIMTRPDMSQPMEPFVRPWCIYGNLAPIRTSLKLPISLRELEIVLGPKLSTPVLSQND